MWIKLKTKLTQKQEKLIKVFTPKQYKAYRQKLYAMTSILLDQLGIDTNKKQEMLMGMFNKWSRKQLTLPELEVFTDFLEGMYNKKNG